MPVIAEEINATRSAAAETVIVPGDTLSIRAISFIQLAQPELSFELVVGEDGRVVVPGMGTAQVSGHTPAQVTKSLSEALKNDIAGHLVVNIAQPAPRTIHVTGSVGKGGEITLPPDGHMTLVEAFAAAGGVSAPYASYLGNTLLVRWDEDSQTQQSWVIDARHKWWGSPNTIFLQANDIVLVPPTPVVRVNAWIDHFIIRNIPFPRFIVPGA